MDVPSETVIAILTYLLPGFITAAIVYALTPEPRPIPFERVVQALIFTMVVQVAVSGSGATLRWVGSHWYAIGPLDGAGPSRVVGRARRTAWAIPGLGGEHRPDSRTLESVWHNLPNVVLL